MDLKNKKNELPLYSLTLQERREALTAAKVKLSPEEQLRIDTLVNDLVDAVKARHPNIGFSRDGALEIIAALGMFFIRRNI